MKKNLNNYARRNDDGGGNEIGVTGFLFAAILMIILVYETIKAIIGG